MSWLTSGDMVRDLVMWYGFWQYGRGFGNGVLTPAVPEPVVLLFNVAIMTLV